MPSYLQATRHPWACLLFLLPLLIVYEVGVHMVGGTEATAPRNGADAWMRRILTDYHTLAAWVPPWALVALLGFWSLWRWSDRPREPLTACFGITLESAAFAGILWLVSTNFRMLMDQAGIPLTQIELNGSVDAREAAIRRLLEYLGAGIYEELLFRLGLFSLLALVFRVALLPGLPANILAAILAAVLFAAAHHIGPSGEKVETPVFLFRTMAGLFFTILYLTRGFGVAVGAHAGYDILAGPPLG